MALLLNAGDTVSRSYSYTQPSPLHPIYPSECGDKTANLFDKSKRTDNSRVVYTTGEIGALFGAFVSDFTPIEPNTTYTLNIVSSISGKTGHLFALYDENKNFVNTGAHEASSATVVYTFTTPSNVAYIRFNGNMSSVDEIMLNAGSTALPHEPYGFEISISSANTTTPIYLGEVETTRQIKKLVLTGGSADGNTNITAQGVIYITPTTTLKSVGAAYCTHFKYVNQSQGSGMPNNSFTTSGGAGISLWFKTNYTSVADFESYLAQQYANGTPVTVWYVLATETTGIVNEPIRKIGSYVDTVSGISIPTITGKDMVDVETTLKPSKVELTYTGWHDASVKEYDGSQWNE